MECKCWIDGWEEGWSDEGRDEVVEGTLMPSYT